MKTYRKFYPGEIIRIGEAPGEDEGKRKPKVKEYEVIQQYSNHVLCKDHNGNRRCVSHADLLCQGIIYDRPFPEEDNRIPEQKGSRKKAAKCKN